VNGWGSHPADRVNDENQETVEAEDDDEDTQSLDRHHKSMKAEEAKLKTRLAELNKEEKTHITFSGLLNVIDGPGAKEGRFLILTTNAIRSLDGALRRHGRCDRTWYMSRATPAMAAVTFRRIFGQDPCRTHDLPEIHRLSLEFGKQVTPDTFAPCEIQEYCMSHRGQPEQAVEDWQRYLQMKASGEDDVQYDINDEEQAEPDYLTGAPEGWDKALDSYDQYMEGLNKMTEHELSGSSMQQLRAPPPEESLAFGDFHSEVPRDEPDDGVLEAVRGVSYSALYSSDQNTKTWPVNLGSLRENRSLHLRLRLRLMSFGLRTRSLKLALLDGLALIPTLLCQTVVNFVVATL
jgi:hypothetical protein